MQSNTIKPFLFINQQEVKKSFFYSFNNLNTEAKLEDLFKAVCQEKKQYFELTDVFGKQLSPNISIEDARCLQPFYILRTLPFSIKLHIQLPSGTTPLNFEVSPADDLIKVQEYVEQKTGILKDIQIFYIGSNQLVGGRALFCQGVIEPKVTLKLDLKTKYSMQWDNGSCDIYIDLSRCSELKTIVYEKTGVLYDFHKVYCGGKELKDPFDLLGTAERDLIVEKRPEITFKLGENQYQLYSNFDDKIGEIKKRFESLKKSQKMIPQDFYDFEYGGKLLEDEKTLEEYTKEKDIVFKVKPRHGNIFVRLSTPIQYLLIGLSRPKTVLDLKKLIMGNL